MKQVTNNYVLYNDGGKWKIVENATIFTDDDVEVVGFQSLELLNEYITKNNITITNEYDDANIQ